MQITVQKLWPLDGKPNGGFKGTDGKTYKCDAATYGHLHEGMTFESNVKPSEWQGKTFYWLPKNFTPDNTVGAIIPQPNGTASPVGRPANGYGDKDVLIVAQVLLKGFLSTNQFGLTDLETLEGTCVASAKRIVAACR